MYPYLPKIFVPPVPDADPESLYSLVDNHLQRHTDPTEILVLTAGYCADIDFDFPTAGCGVFLGPTDPTKIMGLAFCLEATGPFGNQSNPTLRRAQIRAVIAAIQFLTKEAAGFRRIVIATESTFLATGITEWIGIWRGNGWRFRTGEPVLDHDLWEHLIFTLWLFCNDAVEVLFWPIPNSWNIPANRLAKEGAYDQQFPSYTTMI